MGARGGACSGDTRQCSLHGLCHPCTPHTQTVPGACSPVPPPPPRPQHTHPHLTGQAPCITRNTCRKEGPKRCPCGPPSSCSTTPEWLRHMCRSAAMRRYWRSAGRGGGAQRQAGRQAGVEAWREAAHHDVPAQMPAGAACKVALLMVAQWIQYAPPVPPAWKRFPAQHCPPTPSPHLPAAGCRRSGAHSRPPPAAAR